MPTDAGVASVARAASPRSNGQLQGVLATVETIRGSAERIERMFDPVAVEEHKDAAAGPTYYDSADAVAAALATATEEAERYALSREKVGQLIRIYNAYVPWVLRACRARTTEVEQTVLHAHGGGGSANAAVVSQAQEDLGKITHTVGCLGANVEEACTFLGKVGRTKEGAHDAGARYRTRTAATPSVSARAGRGTGGVCCLARDVRPGFCPTSW
jgi:hypothetical protein